MKKMSKRFFSLLLVLSMVIGVFAMPAMAAPAQTEPVVSGQSGTTDQSSAQTGSQQESGNKFVISDEVIFNSETLKVDLSGDVQVDESAIDYDDPAIILVEEELKTMKVLNDDGQQVALTPEQIGTVLYLYQQYLDHWES